MTDHLAVLERILADHLGVLHDHVPDFEKRELTEETAALRAAIALMRGQSWQRIDEFTPRNRAFLAWGKGMGTWIASLRANGDWDDGDFHSSIRGLTHYSELPDPPKGHSR